MDRLEQIQIRLSFFGSLRGSTAQLAQFRQGRAVLVKPEIPRIDVEMDVGIPEITGPEYALQYRGRLENLLLWRENPWEGPTKAIQRSNRKHAIQTKREIAELLEEMSAILEAEKQDVER